MSLNSSLQQPNSEALRLSQQTAQYLQKHGTTGTSTIPIPFISYAESTEIWLMYEKMLLSCLRTGDDKAAHICLEKLIQRFGATNERVMGLRGLYQEAVAEDDSALERILKEYNEVLAENPINTPVAKRRVALLRSLSRITDAIYALIQLLQSSPTDIEAWTELSDLYLSQNLFTQSTFCLEEVLLVAPNAWNINARLGEVLFMSATSMSDSTEGNTLVEAIRRFCRSVELCDDYLRGYYGLKMASDRLLARFFDDSNDNPNIQVTDYSEVLPPQKATVQKLNEQATSKLAELTRRISYNVDNAEIVAAKILLDKSTQTRQR